MLNCIRTITGCHINGYRFNATCPYYRPCTHLEREAIPGMFAKVTTPILVQIVQSCAFICTEFEPAKEVAAERLSLRKSSWLGYKFPSPEADCITLQTTHVLYGGVRRRAVHTPTCAICFQFTLNLPRDSCQKHSTYAHLGLFKNKTPQCQSSFCAKHKKSQVSLPREICNIFSEAILSGQYTL